MAQAMYPMDRHRQAASFRPLIGRLVEGRPCEGPHRLSASEKDLPIRLRRGEASALEVRQEGGTGLVGEGQPQDAASFPLSNSESSGPPFEVVQRQAHDLRRTQAVGGDQE